MKCIIFYFIGHNFYLVGKLMRVCSLCEEMIMQRFKLEVFAMNCEGRINVVKETL